MAMGFDISISGLSAAQKGIQVTQNNISNMNTEGYARQELILTAQNILSGSGVEKSIGSGVLSDKIERVIDEYLVNQARQEQSKVGYYNSLETDLRTIENYFNDNSSGSVTTLLSDFFNAWEEASKYPEEASYRTAVIASGEMLVDKFQQLNTDLKSMAAEVETDIRVKTKEVNNLIAKIENVNDRIAKAGTNEPNALYDERDSYLDALASLTDLKITNDEQNPRLINLEIGGITVLSKNKSEPLEAKFESSEQRWIMTSGNRVLDMKSGSLTASLELRNDGLAKYTEKMDELAKEVIDQTNAIYETGFDTANTTGQKFFEGSSLITIKVNEDLIGNPEKLALSSKADTPGNSDIAKKLYDLRSALTMKGGSTSMIGYYNDFVVDMASELGGVKNNLTIHESMAVKVEENRQSVQGVNLDEELGNLMKFQQYYAANSKVINTVNQLYDTLMNMI